jgi:hypothetical protein
VKNVYVILVGKPHLSEINVDEMTNKWEQGSNVWTGSIWLRMGAMTEFCEHGYEPFMK